MIYFLSDYEIVMIDSGEFEDPEMIAYFDATVLKDNLFIINSIAFSERFCKTFDICPILQYNISATKPDSRGRRPKGRG